MSVFRILLFSAFKLAYALFSFGITGQSNTSTPLATNSFRSFFRSEFHVPKVVQQIHCEHLDQMDCHVNLATIDVDIKRKNRDVMLLSSLYWPVRNQIINFLHHSLCFSQRNNDFNVVHQVIS